MFGSSGQNFGVVFDPAMSVERRSEQAMRKCFFELGNISKLGAPVSKAELEPIIHSFISSCLDYFLFTCLNIK